MFFSDSEMTTFRALFGNQFAEAIDGAKIDTEQDAIFGHLSPRGNTSHLGVEPKEERTDRDTFKPGNFKHNEDLLEKMIPSAKKTKSHWDSKSQSGIAKGVRR